MNRAKKLLKNSLLQNRFFLKKNIKYILILYVFLLSVLSKSQIANYVNNGSFEDSYNCSFPTNLEKAKHWRSIDSLSNGGSYCSACSGIGNVPLSGLTYQVPKSGISYIVCSYFCQPPTCTNTNNRGYQRNRLKQPLQAGKKYCVKFYVNITNPSTYGMDGFGAYFGDNTLDTITQTTIPLTYLIPQIQNPINNMITDTLGWSLITGTFVAMGNEKHMVIGNFKSDANTNKVLINSTNLPAVFSDIALDDVSCIDIDLPAFAGSDIFGIPNNTVYIGRPQDVGIDEACMWYKLPNTTTAIDTAAGITRTVSLSIDTYVVRQEICGNVKWDTVVVYPSGVGENELTINNEKLRIYPNPAQDQINLSFDFNINSKKILIYNSIGQMLREENVIFKNKTGIINTKDLANGVYLLTFQHVQEGYILNINKRFTITK